MPSEHIDGEFLDTTSVIAFWRRHFSCLPSSIFSFHKALYFSSCSWSPWNSFFYVHRLKSQHSAQAIRQGWKKRALGPQSWKGIGTGMRWKLCWGNSALVSSLAIFITGEECTHSRHACLSLYSDTEVSSDWLQWCLSFSCLLPWKTADPGHTWPPISILCHERKQKP